MLRAAAIAALTFVAAACGRPPGLAAPAGPMADASTTPPPVARARITARATDPIWVRARGGDALAVARLADAAGAAELLEGVEDGGAVRATALLALPHAEDADLALQRLGEIALAEEAASAHDVLEAILAIAHRPRDQREPVDPEGPRRAGEAMLAVAKRPGLSEEDGALALSAARALAERGYLDPARIP